MNVDGDVDIALSLGRKPDRDGVGDDTLACL